MNVFRSAIWILAEYADNSGVILKVIDMIKQSLGEIPIVESEIRSLEEKEDTITSQNDQKNHPKVF